MEGRKTRASRVQAAVQCRAPRPGVASTSFRRGFSGVSLAAGGAEVCDRRCDCGCSPPNYPVSWSRADFPKRGAEPRIRGLWGTRPTKAQMVSAVS